MQKGDASRMSQQQQPRHWNEHISWRALGEVGDGARGKGTEAGGHRASRAGTQSHLCPGRADSFMDFIILPESTLVTSFAWNAEKIVVLAG